MREGARFPKFWSPRCSFRQPRLSVPPGAGLLLGAAGPPRLTDRAASLTPEMPGAAGQRGRGRDAAAAATGAQPFLNHGLGPGRDRDSRPPQPSRVGRPRGREGAPPHAGGPTEDAGAGEGARASSTARRLRRSTSRGPRAAGSSGSVTHILTAAAATRKHQPGTKTRRRTGRGEDK